MPTLTLGQLSTFTRPILPNVIEEALVEYLQSPASYVPVVSDKSPIDHHFSHVEQFMSRYVPSNSAMLKSIRLSFAKLAATPTIFDASCCLSTASRALSRILYKSMRLWSPKFVTLILTIQA